MHCNSLYRYMTKLRLPHLIPIQNMRFEPTKILCTFAGDCSCNGYLEDGRGECGEVRSQDDSNCGNWSDFPHICHNHHNCWLCKSFESSVKFSTWYMKESALSVIFYRVCNLTHGVVFHPTSNFKQFVI